MKASLKFAALSLALLCSCQSNDGWQKLFNGKDLTGFKQLNGEAPYWVEDGCLVGTSVTGQPNSFMATEQEYAWLPMRNGPFRQSMERRRLRRGTPWLAGDARR